MFNPHTQAYRLEMLHKWNAAWPTDARKYDLALDANKILKFKDEFYASVSRATGVPWWLVGCFDMREESFDHTSNLCNGDPLDRPTVHVPRGVGPFSTWSAGAIFAMHYDRLVANDLIGWLIEAERYNGEGYHKHTNPAAPSSPEPSPYIWSFTNVYTSGKYSSDGHWDPNLVDRQAGVAAIAKYLQSHKVDLGVPLFRGPV